MSNMSQRYTQQVAKLKQSAQRFSEHYPALTEHLIRDRSDPDVAMVMQGLAYISAELEQQIEHQFPAALQALSQVLVPSLMQPIPSASVMCYTPKSILKSPFVVPKGTYFDSNPLLSDSDSRAKPMRFKSTQDIEVLPIVIANVSQQTVTPAQSQQPPSQHLIIDLDCSSAELSTYDFSTLPFYIHRPYSDATQWFKLLSQQLTRMTITDDTGETVIPIANLRTAGFNNDNSVFANTEYGSCHDLLQEYFLFSERLFFFDLDLSAWQKRRGRRAQLRFEFDNYGRQLPDLNKQHVHLFCTPVINRFSHYAEPVQMADFSGEYPIFARLRDVGRERSLTIIDVLKVESIAEGRDDNIRYDNINSPHVVGGNAGYHYYRMQGVFGSEVEDIVALQVANTVALDDEQVLRVKVDCCHGDRGSQINPGDINQPATNTPEVISFTNITACSDYLEPIIADDLVWQLVSDHSAGVNSLTSALQLQEFMQHHLPIQLKGSAFYQSALHKIQGITDFSVSYIDHVNNGKVYRGRGYHLTLATDHFVNSGDSFVFAVLVRQLLLMSTAINSGLVFDYLDSFSGQTTAWPFTLGGSA